MHGSGLTTLDLDITPAGDGENLTRLAAALAELDARLRVSGGPPVAFPFESDFLAQLSVLTSRTRFGDLDVCFRPAGTPRPYDYESLRRNAVVVELPEPVAVASLDDVIGSKQAAARDKDLAALPVLYRLREILRGR